MDAQRNEVATLMSIARESLVMLTVVFIAIVAYFFWLKVLKPFMDQQTAIATANANALNSIQMSAQAIAAANASVESQSRHLAHASSTLLEATQELKKRS